MYREKIVNTETGEETWRDLTPEEVAKIEKAKLEVEQLIAQENEKLAKRQALLAKLGITEEEAKLLLS